MNIDRVPVKLPAFALTEFEGDLLLHSPSKEDVMVISESGAIIWQLCDGNRTQPQIVQLLKDSYPEIGDAIASDVDDFINEINEWGGLSFVS